MVDLGAPRSPGGLGVVYERVASHFELSFKLLQGPHAIGLDITETDYGWDFVAIEEGATAGIGTRGIPIEPSVDHEMNRVTVVLKDVLPEAGERVATTYLNAWERNGIAIHPSDRSPTCGSTMSTTPSRLLGSR